MTPHAPRCSDASLTAGEPLFGTATEDTDVWVLLEVEGRWEAKAFEGWSEPADTAGGRAVDKTPFERFLAANPRVRLQLIRRGDPDVAQTLSTRGRHLFVCSSADRPHGRVLRFERGSDLDTVDLDGMLAGRVGEPVTEPMVLVCTHGRRDPCCARYGPPFHRAAAAAAPGRVWQTSHMGGHRFAPTVLCLPFGNQYGRVPVEHAAALVRANEQGLLHDLHDYRGRTCFDPPTQAAEILLRQELRELRQDALRLVSSDKIGTDRFRRTFAAGEALHVVEVTRRVGLVPVPGSCGKPGGDPATHYDRVVR